MKNYNFPFYALLLFVLSACSAKTIGINQVDDDVYWSRQNEPKSGQSYKDAEPWNKNKGPNVGATEGRYAPIYQNIEAGQNQTTVNSDEIRAQEAYYAWNAKRDFSSQSNDDTTKQSNLLMDDKNDGRDARRFGSDRQYYYDDPYYNSLSSNWGWTDLFTPVVRPGFFNWAPGYNIGLNWNNNSGFNNGFGYNSGFGMNMGNGFSPYNNFNNSFYGNNSWGFGNPYGFNPYMGYDPFFGYNQFGYNPYCGYGYNPFFDPLGNRFNNGFCYGSGWGNRRFNNNNGNDIVTNRAIMQPRNSMGSSVPSAGSRPGASGEKQSMRPNGSVDQAINPMNQPASVRPNNNVNYRPNRPVTDPNNVSTNRPGGDLSYDRNGRPVYVSPNTNNRPSSSGGTSTYSDRAGGELRTRSDGKQVYVPTRPRDNGSSNARPNVNNSPSRAGDRNRGETPSYRSPSVSPGNQDSRPSNRGNTNNSPTYRAPSNPQPSQSRPSSSPPSSPRPSSGGGSSGSGGGGNFRPR
jgi:hypothetical protein